MNERVELGLKYRLCSGEIYTVVDFSVETATLENDACKGDYCEMSLDEDGTPAEWERGLWEQVGVIELESSDYDISIRYVDVKDDEDNDDEDEDADDPDDEDEDEYDVDHSAITVRPGAQHSKRKTNIRIGQVWVDEYRNVWRVDDVDDDGVCLSLDEYPVFVRRGVNELEDEIVAGTLTLWVDLDRLASVGQHDIDRETINRLRQENGRLKNAVHMAERKLDRISNVLL